MDNNIKIIINNIADIKIAIIGLGISNRALVKFLNGRGAAHIDVFDKNNNDYVQKNTEKLMSGGLISRAVLGEDYLDRLSEEKYDVIFRSPGIRHDISQFEEAKKHGALITSEMELFFELCPCKIYGVTGSDGKTTTTTLLWRILSAHYKDGKERVWLGGNIGTPLIDVIDEIKPYDSVVLELSSFQLMTMNRSPDISIITNITPNHLDIHKDYDEYINAKRRIFQYRKGEGVTVLNAHNTVTADIARSLLKENRNVRLFSADISQADVFEREFGPCGGIGFASGGDLIWKSSLYNYSIPREMLPVPGKFNSENLLAAVSACGDIVTKSDIENAVKDFTGVEHRCEFVRELRGVRYYNSSIDSSPNRTINTLSVFGDNLIMIAGGKDKNIPYDALGPAIAEKVKLLILTGPTADKIEESVRKAGARSTEILRFSNYKDAVECACSHARSGDSVILSPASTSFDMFRNFEERGNLFKSLVMALK